MGSGFIIIPLGCLIAAFLALREGASQVIEHTYRSPTGQYIATVWMRRTGLLSVSTSFDEYVSINKSDNPLRLAPQIYVATWEPHVFYWRIFTGKLQKMARYTCSG